MVSILNHGTICQICALKVVVCITMTQILVSGALLLYIHSYESIGYLFRVLNFN